jgi:hypothetical protein
MTTDEKLEKWRALGEIYVSTFRGTEEHTETIALVDEILSWDEEDEDTRAAVVMAWEGVGRRILPLVEADEEPDDELAKHMVILKVLLGEPGVQVPSLTIAIDLENVQISDGLDPLNPASYRITITDSEGASVIEDEEPHAVTVNCDTEEE